MYAHTESGMLSHIAFIEVTSILPVPEIRIMHRIYIFLTVGWLTVTSGRDRAISHGVRRGLAKSADVKRAQARTSIKVHRDLDLFQMHLSDVTRILMQFHVARYP